MSTVDDYREAADQGRVAAHDVGERTTTVTIRVITYNGPVGPDATVVSTTDTLLYPNPKVSQLSDVDAGIYGGGFITTSTGVLNIPVYKIGPITQRYSGGGYTLSQLLPTGDITKRVLVLLTGDEFEGNGELCEVVHKDATRPQQINLFVKRAAQDVT